MGITTTSQKRCRAYFACSMYKNPDYVLIVATIESAENSKLKWEKLSARLIGAYEKLQRQRRGSGRAHVAQVRKIYGHLYSVGHFHIFLPCRVRGHWILIPLHRRSSYWRRRYRCRNIRFYAKAGRVPLIVSSLIHSTRRSTSSTHRHHLASSGDALAKPLSQSRVR